ncbi:hypothetical protein D3C71_1774210 [compost metagenome]
MLARGQGHGSECGFGGAEFAHMPPVDHGVPRGRSEPAIGRVIATRPAICLPRTAARVVCVGNERNLALAGLDGHHRHIDQGDVGRAPLVPSASPTRLKANRLRDLLSIKNFLGGGSGDFEE